MRLALLVAACVLSLGSVPAIQAQEAPNVDVLVQAMTWTHSTYHRNYPTYCTTCYGGGGCHQCSGGACDGCHGDNLKGVGACACHAPGIDTCRKCGLFGRVFFYECKRLAYGQEGGQGCHGVFLDDQCTGCSPCAQKKKHQGLIDEIRSRPLGGYAAYSGPYQARYAGSGWREGPMTHNGWVCGSYESYLNGQYDARGPLNGGHAGPVHRHGAIHHHGATHHHGGPVLAK